MEAPFSLQLEAGATTSAWSELDTSGHELVHEQGNLKVYAGTFEIRYDPWIFNLRHAQTGGIRTYTGEVAPGRYAVSGTAVQAVQNRVQLVRNVDAAWGLGIRLSADVTDRRIDSVDEFNGSSERYATQVVSMGALWRSAWREGALEVGVWRGQSWDARMHLALAGVDRIPLVLADIRQFDVELVWSTPLGKSLTLQWISALQLREFDQSGVTQMTRNGVPIGLAFQPRTVIRSMPVHFGINYQF